MNIVLGILFLWAAWTHLQDVIDPDRLTRLQVRINSGMMAIFCLGFAYVSLKMAGIL